MMLYSAFFLIMSTILVMLLWPVRQHRRFCVLLSILFLAGGFGLYALLGSPGIVPLLKAHNQRLQKLQTIISEQSVAVKDNPKQLDGWVKLGAAFMEAGQYAAAANAFKQSVLLSKGNPALILAYAKAMIAADNGNISDHSKKSLEMVLLQEPGNADARYWLIVRTLQDGDNESAMKAMKTLYHELPADSPLKAMIDRQIGRRVTDDE